MEEDTGHENKKIVTEKVVTEKKPLEYPDSHCCYQLRQKLGLSDSVSKLRFRCIVGATCQVKYDFYSSLVYIENGVWWGMYDG